MVAAMVVVVVVIVVVAMTTVVVANHVAHLAGGSGVQWNSSSVETVWRGGY